MKKILFSIALICPLRTLLAQSNQQERTNIVQMSLPLHLIDNNNNESYYLFDLAFKISYEHRFSKTICPIIQIGYHGPFTFDIETAEAQEEIKTTGMNFQIGNKFYFNENRTASGFYMSPQFIFNTVKLFEDGSVPGGYIKFQDSGLAGIIGYQMVSLKGFALDVFSGACIFRRNYFDNTLIESLITINHNETGIRPNIGVKFGYSF